jgi:hypothetical protein
MAMDVDRPADSATNVGNCGVVHTFSEKMLATISFLLLTAAAPHVRSVAEPEVRIGQTLTLRVDNLEPGQCKSLVLFVDGLAIDGLVPDCSRRGEVRYVLAVNEKNAADWRTLFARAPGCCRNVSVSAGGGIYQLPTDVNSQPMRIINPVRWLLTILVALLLTITIFVLRWRTTLLTNLPRLQVGFFAVVITVAYGYIWSTTGEVSTINASALALLGIGAGTVIGHSILASGRRVSAASAAQTIANSSGIEAPAETQVRFNLHSLQSAVWTLAIGVIFFGTVYRMVVMPDFDSRVLSILGISAGTYIAFAFKKQ